MVKIIKTVEELQEEINAARSKIIILDFFADWCGPCKMISPKLEEWDKAFDNIVVLKVDVDESECLAEKYEISVMPTFIVLKDGVVADTLIGADAAKVENMFKKYDKECSA